MVSCRPSPMTHLDMGPAGVPPAQPRRSRWWIWLVAGVGVLTFSCVGCVGWLGYVGMNGPETSIYAGNEVPRRFLDIMRDVGALDADETPLYFYSDAFLDIRKGFSFVSDRKVATYSSLHQPALTVIDFDDIAQLTLYRNESLFFDSELVIELQDGTPIRFPLSSEQDGDNRFHDAIESRLPTG